MKFTKALVAAAALAAAGVAQAATPYTLGDTATFLLAPDSFIEYSFTVTAAGNSLLSVLTTPSLAELSLTSIGGSPVTPTSSFSQFTPGFSIPGAITLPSIFLVQNTYIGLSAGSYIAKISNTDLTSYIGGSFQSGFTAVSNPAAVPEPGVVALVLAGMGVVGLLGRRKKV